MHIIIIGAGDAGQRLAEHLHQERHDVVIVDSDQSALDDVESRMDVHTVQGLGGRPRVLEEAGLAKADLLLAVSSSNETNLLACLWARHAGVNSVVARITHIDHARPEYLDMGINHIVNEHEECAIDLEHVIRIPAAHEATLLFDGKILGAGMLVSLDSPLIRSKLSEMEEPARFANVRIAVCQRGKDAFIPDGDTQLMIGDDVYVLGKVEDVEAFMAWASPSVLPFKRVVLAGGGALARPLLRRLGGTGRDIVVIEQDESRASRLSDLYDKCLILCGDCLDQQTLEDANFNDQTMFIATTGNDQNNMVSCMLAEKLGAAFTAARISRAQYAPVISSLSLLDRVVNPYLALFNSIMHFVRGRNVKLETRLQDVDGEMLEFDLSAGHPWAAHRVLEIEVPEGVILGMVMRGQDVIVVTGSLTLEVGDRLAIFALKDAIKPITKLFADVS